MNIFPLFVIPFRLTTIFLLMVSALLSHTAQAQSDMPMSIFGSLPEIDDAAIAPDGKTIALLENIQGITIVRFFDLSTGQSQKALRIGKAKARNLLWANNDRILLQVSKAETINTVDGLKTFEIWRYAS